MPRQLVWRRGVWMGLLSVLGSIGALAEPLVIDPHGVTDLDGPWAFHAGDVVDWADPDIDDSPWTRKRLVDGFAEHEADDGWAWYRRTLDVTPNGGLLSDIDRAALHLGVATGKVDSAYELYAGGRRLGGIGGLPPEPEIDYDRHGFFHIPPSAIADDGRLVLALRVWASPETRLTVNGPREGTFEIGPRDTLVRQSLIREMPFLFLAGWYLIIGLMHLELFLRRRQSRGYLWFALLALGFGAYSFLRTQWKYQLGLPFEWLKELEHGLCYANTVLFIQLFWPLLGLEVGRGLRAVQALCLAMGTLALLPGLTVNLVLLPFWQAMVLGVLFAAIGQIFLGIRRDIPGVRGLAVGGVVAVIFVASDVAVDRGLYVAPRLAAIGFGVFVTALALTLAHRFVRLHAEVEALRRSEEANRVKSDFLANMSHELRTPITGILGTADLLRRSDLPARANEFAGIIQSSAQSLLAIVDDVLDFSKVEAGHLALESVVFPLPETVRGVIDLLAPRARSKGIALGLKIDPKTPRLVEGDPLRLRQVLLNLVGNAVKFTSEGHVTLRLRRLDSTERLVRLRFSVHDTGIGIADADLERLFLPFTQADSSTTRRFGGTGLGLAISRRIVEAMGGRLAAESEPGQGSTFSFEVELPAASGSDAYPELDDETISVIAPVAQPATPKHILLVEDNPINHLVVLEQLATLGHRVTSAYDGRKALELLDSETFDLVFMDCQMPELDGYEATRRVRQQEIGDRHLPIIALTAHALEGDREKCLAAGMDDYLAKPFTTEQLTTILSQWLGTDP